MCILHREGHTLTLKLMNCLVLWCVQMDRLSLVGTNEIKYTEQ